MRHLWLGIVLSGCIGVLSNEGFAQVSEGNMPYTPTRLEWLEMYLNSGKSVPYGKETGFGISFLADGETNTLFIVVFVNQETVDTAALNSALKSSRRLVNAYAQRKGWDEWLKIEERLQDVRSPKTPVRPPPSGDRPAEGRP